MGIMGMVLYMEQLYARAFDSASDKIASLPGVVSW